MAEHAPAPAVALLFADAELGAHLREALLALGASIVHEGPATAVQGADLRAADVVVVNLDAAVEDNFEQLYAALDEPRQRVVFNDAQASRGLSGWDRARWARHLAAKLVDAGDVDPPRPADAPGAPALQVEQRQTVATPAPPAEWDLVDFEAAPVAPAVREDAAAFGIEKQAAAEFLAPDAAPHDPAMELTSTLELVSMEEAVAPGMHDAPVHEMMLDDSRGGIRHVLLLGAAIEDGGAVREMLAGLPPTLPALVLVIQHQRDGDAAKTLAAEFSTCTRLPVRVATDNMQTRQGEVVLLPAGQQVSVGRDGRLSAQPLGRKNACDPSIDQCFTMAAAAFGADVVAIVLAGNANDAVAGVQAVHDRGGRVWVQYPAPATSTMVATIREEGLVDFAGTPATLLAHLREEYA